MTNKIIIDGIDVSKCEYFCKFTDICRNENIGRVIRPECKNVRDCYYKQKKRTEQECKKYKQALDEIEKYTIKQFCDNCEEICSTELTCHCEFCEYYEFFDIINKAKEQ